MTREQAYRVLTAAARKAVETRRENYTSDGQYLRVMGERLEKLRLALRDVDESKDEAKKA